jgi:predicted transport protein
MSSPQDAESTMVKNLKDKFGKSLDEWIKDVNKKGLTKHGEILKYLKSEHGFTHGYANLVSLKARKTDAGSAESGDLVADQYSGDKANLKPIYDALVKEINKFGSDVELAPKKAYVSIRRKKQFAIIQPSTKTRVDVGINFKDVPPKGRLEKSGSFNAMVSHRVKVSDKKEVDKELVAWLKRAYEGS